MKDNKEDRATFAKVMWGVAGNFGGKISNDDLTLRFEVLKDFSIDQITTAGTWLLRHREVTFPAVPTTKEFIDAINGQENGSVSPMSIAGLEADKVLEALKAWGRDAEPLFIDEITKYLMTHRWTFPTLDVMAIKDPGLVWWRKEFIESYLDLAKDQAAGCDVLCLGAVNNGKLEGIADSSVKRLEESIH